MISTIPVIKASVSSYVFPPAANAADALPIFVARSADETAVRFDFIFL